MSWATVSLGEICRPKQHKTIPSTELLDDGYVVYGANGPIGYYSEYTHNRTTIAVTCRGATCGTINIVGSIRISYAHGLTGRIPAAAARTARGVGCLGSTAR